MGIEEIPNLISIHFSVAITEFWSGRGVYDCPKMMKFCAWKPKKLGNPGNTKFNCPGYAGDHVCSRGPKDTCPVAKCCKNIGCTHEAVDGVSGIPSIPPTVCPP